jgi:hypothetical protein
MPETGRSRKKPRRRDLHPRPLEAVLRAALAQPFGPDEAHVKQWLTAMVSHGRRTKHGGGSGKRNRQKV